MFKALDKNNDGYLYLEEIKHLWAIFTNENCDIPSDEEITEIVENLDINGDGKIDYNEFLAQFDFEEINFDFVSGSIFTLYFLFFICFVVFTLDSAWRPSPLPAPSPEKASGTKVNN